MKQILKKVQYSELSGRQKEIYNFQKVAGLLADYGYNCIRLLDDWKGADFLAFHFSDAEPLKVQLKSRPTIDKKYKNSSLYLAFPIRKGSRETWHLVPNVRFEVLVRRHTKWMDSKSWENLELYHNDRPNAALVHSLKKYALKDFKATN